LLSDIPLIGKLFQAHNNTVDDSELLIFLTARIVPDSTPGALTTGEPMP
jgi:type II secretory pathway component GspD/PulD (secretin)